MRKLISIILLASILTGCGYEEAVRQLDTYCEMVAAGDWPDYKGIYEDECT